MLPLQFFGQNIHFAVNLLAGLVFFAVFWLYFDAWATTQREFTVLAKWAGFLLVSLSYLTQSAVIEQSVLGSTSLNSVLQTVSMSLCVAGFVLIIAGKLTDPLQKKPELSGLKAEEYSTVKPTQRKLPLFGAVGLVNPLHWFPPLGAITIGAFYWRRATKGLERHLKPVAVAFGLLFISQLLGLASLWRGTSNPTLSKLVEAFGALWIGELVFLLAATVVLGCWVWKYLTRRFMSQLFMIFTSGAIVIFLITAVSFTYLLVNNVQKNSLDNLDTAASVLSYALGSKQSVVLADTQAIAENPAVVNAVGAADHSTLTSLTNDYLRSNKLSSLIVTSGAGEVLLRAQNPDRWGDSISSSPVVRRALIGQSVSSVGVQNGVLAPQLYIQSSVPIWDSTTNRIVGSAQSTLVLDSAFVDGVKQATGLDSSIYAGDEVSATTFLAPDGLTRWIGVKETSSAVANTVLKAGQTFKGTLSIQNRQYLAVFKPLRDINNNILGMLFIGQPQVTVLQTAGRSVELTFVITAILVVLSVIPAFLISKFLARQLD
jgi:hypothetical protein